MPDILKISVALTGEQVATLKAAVDSGEYATTSEGVREALRDWHLKRRRQREDIGRLRELWDEGKASGPAQPFDSKRTLAAARLRLKRSGPGDDGSYASRCAVYRKADRGAEVLIDKD